MGYFNSPNVLTGRATRRYEERRNREEAKQREAVEKLNYWKSMTPEEKARHKKTQEAVARIERNGITMDDLEQQYNQGLQDGYKAGSGQTFEAMFAAVALSLNEIHGFDAEQCVEVMNMAHEKVFYAISKDEIIKEAFDSLGIEIVFDDGDISAEVKDA